MKRFLLYLLVACGILTTGCDQDEPTTPSITLSQNNIEAWFDAGDYSIEINATCAWEATSDSDWVIIANENGTKGVSELKFSLLQNSSTEVRTAKISISNKEYNLTEEITISQAILLDEYFQITYTSRDGKAVEPYTAEAFDAEIESNNYTNGIGTLRFKTPISKVGEMAFCDCVSLKSITLPNSITEIGGWAFFGCFYLEEATLSSRLKTIGDAAFSSCSTLSSITLPQSLDYVGDSAFYGCSGMAGYYGKFASEDNRCLVIGNVLRHFAPKGITQYEIPKDITTIAHDAFYESLRLKSVTIPESITSIGEYAFYYCESLKSVYCKRSTPPGLGTSVFDNSDNGTDKPIGCKIYVPTSAVDLYKSAENWSRYKSYIYGDESL